MIKRFVIPFLLTLGLLLLATCRPLPTPAPAGPCDKNAPERADLKDNNCNGFGDEPPVGFAREASTMQGFASAVEWYGEYIYLAAGAVLQIYRAPAGAQPTLVYEIEMRDWAREMAVDGDTLFVAARGDGLLAFDLKADPARPKPAGRVSGLFSAANFNNVEAVFNGVDAKRGRVAVARVNSVAQNQGGVDAVVFSYDPASDAFTVVKAFGTDVRSKALPESPISVGLTEDGSGLYIGYGILIGELVYAPIDKPGDPVLRKDTGAVMDIATKGNTAFIAITGLALPNADNPMLSRISIGASNLIEKPIVTNRGLIAGYSVDIHGDLLCFGGGGVARYEAGRYDLWAFTNLLAETPTRIGAAGTPDWIYQLACRDAPTGSDWIYVANEWGGLQLWESNGKALTLNLNRDRVATGMFGFKIWSDATKIYAIKEGGGLWIVDESALSRERAAVEWIDRADPGCKCAGCCPPQQGAWNYPPAIFVSGGASNQGRVALLAQDRNTAVPGAGFFMLFEEKGDKHALIYSEPVSSWSGMLVRNAQTNPELLFTSTLANALHVRQHCPKDAEPMRVLGKIDLPTQDRNWLIADVAVWGDYLFVAEGHRPLLADADTGKIHIFRWKQGDLAKCPARPALLNPPQYLGAFASDLIPHRLVADTTRNRLIVGCSAKTTFPIKEGALVFYDLANFDPNKIADLDKSRKLKTPDATMRVTHPNIQDIMLDGDALYLADFDNGVYYYSLSKETYLGFYPAHRGTMRQAYVPQRVLSSDGIMPLYHPISLALTASGKLAVLEHVPGRITFLAKPR